MTRKLAVVLVAAAVLLGSGVGWTIAAVSSASRGKPWFKVGPGWFLESVTTHPGTKIEATWLVLIGPHGVAHRVFEAPGSADLVAWSGDGRRAVLYGAFRSKKTTVTEVVDLRTGHVTPVSWLGGGSTTEVVGFTPTDSQGVLTVTQTRSGGTLQRRALDGSHPVTIARNAGVLAYGAITATADGQAYFLVQNNQIMVVPSRATSVSVPVPSSTGCEPVRLWSRTQLLALCGETGPKVPAGGGRLELLPLQGGAPHVIARDTEYPLTQINIDAYRARGGIYAKTATGCGTPWISRIAPNGTVSPLGKTKDGPTGYKLLSSNGRDLLVVLTGAGCTAGARQTLAWMDPVTQRTQTIISAPIVEGPRFIPFPTYNHIA